MTLVLTSPEPHVLVAWQDDWSHLFAGPLAMPSLKAKRVVGEDGVIPDKVRLDWTWLGFDLAWLGLRWT